MTTHDERIRAIKNTGEFLYSLLDPKKTPRVPRAVREVAYACLRHYPGNAHLDDVFADCKLLDVVKKHKRK